MSKIEILETIQTPGPAPAGTVWDGQYLWLNDYQTAVLYRLDLNSKKSEDWMLCAGVISGLGWDGQALWQSRFDESWLQRINRDTHDIDQTIEIKDHSLLSGVAWDGSFIWVVSQNTGSLVAIDSETGHILRQLKIPIASGGLSFHHDALWLGVADTMIFNEQTQSFSWVSNEQSYAVVELSPFDGQEINRYSIEFLPLGITWIEDILWLTEPSKGKLHRGRLS
jgi:outer membrane protein assembly factor BamB